MKSTTLTLLGFYLGGMVVDELIRSNQSWWVPLIVGVAMGGLGGALGWRLEWKP